MSALATDTFTRGDETPLAGNWSTAGDSDQFFLTGNHVGVSGNNDTSAFYNALAWPDDHYSQAAVTGAAGVGGGAGIGPGVRMATGKNYYRLVAGHLGSNNVELLKKVNGVATQIWLRTSAFADGAIFYLEAQGTTLIAKNGGVAIGASATDSSLTAGSAGITYSSEAVGSSLDDWEGGDFGPAAKAAADTEALALAEAPVGLLVAVTVGEY